MVKWGLIEARKDLRKFAREKDWTYLPAGVDTGSPVEKVSGDFVRV